MKRNKPNDAFALLKAGALGLTLGALVACNGGPSLEASSPGSSSSIFSSSSLIAESSSSLTAVSSSAIALSSASSVPSSSSSSSSTISSSSMPSGNVVGATIEAENVNLDLSSNYMSGPLESDPTQTAVGYYDFGSVICYDNINMTGVRSIDFLMAKGMSDPGRFAILLDGNSLNTGTNLGEKITTSTGGWETFQLVNVGLSQDVSGIHKLCFLGLLGGGIFNLDKFTLSDVPGNNDGISANPDDLPENPKPIAKITTQGNKVLFGGQPGSIAGMSLFWSNAGWGGEKFYNANVVSWLKQDWNIKLIRAAMGVGADKSEQGGYLQNKGAQTQLVKTVVNAAIENNIYVIIDWHTHYAEREPAEAVAFFTEMANIYGEYDNVIYEIYNEPLAISWSNTIKPYAQQVIAAIRAIDPDNLIIVGTPNWSQDVDAASLDPITGYKNIAYTLHFYSGTHKQSLRDKATTALNRGIPLFVTEWGSVDADGDGGVNQGETSTWLNFLKSNGISHANWSLNDKPEGSSALVEGANANGGWTDANLTDSGKLLKNTIKNW